MHYPENNYPYYLIYLISPLSFQVNLYLFIINCKLFFTFFKKVRRGGGGWDISFMEVGAKKSKRRTTLDIPASAK
jgi:hypothetical protein